MIDNQFHNLYRNIVLTLLEEGEIVAKTRECLFLNFVLTQPMNNEVLLPKNWAWAYLELFDRLTGANPGLSHLFRAKWADKLEKEGGTYNYSYGSTFAEQLPKVLKAIKTKFDREAIINVWDSRYLDRNTYQRRPCTLTIQFYNKKGYLHLFVNMRSNDVINMLPYDVFLHANLQIYVASLLDLKLGHYHHSASHYYWPKRRDMRNYGKKLYQTLCDTSEGLPDYKEVFPWKEPQKNIILAKEMLHDLIINKKEIFPDLISDPTIRRYIETIKDKKI